MSIKSWLPAAVLTAGCVMASSPALAGNGTHPRTPVDWSGASCMTVIDRSQSPIYQLEYTIPFEDTDVTPDEVVDSRTHQFFAFCRDRHLEDILPGWITEANAIEAAMKGLGELADVDFELHVIENSQEWAGCWSRISEDDERRPITFAAAGEPVPWDTMALPAGTYVVDGYTYEPWFNMWTQHPGVFKIVDDPDPAASDPAAALTFSEQAVFVGEEANITGCVDAMAGSTMSLSWSNGGLGSEPDWQVFAADVPVDNGSFALGYTPTIAAASNSVMIRLEVEDPMGRSWTAYSREYIAVLDNAAETGCEESGGNFVSNPCDDESESGQSDDGSGSGTSDGGTVGSDSGDDSGPPLGEGDGGGDGCGCHSDEGPPSRGLGLLTMIAVLGLRRRRR